MSTTDIARIAIQENPGWAIKCGELLRIAEKYNVDSIKLFKEMVRLSN